MQQPRDVWGQLVAQTLAQMVGEECGPLDEHVCTPTPNGVGADASHETSAVDREVGRARS